MAQDMDERLAKLLLLDAPPARDPLFRLSVLQRRERQRFRQRSVARFMAALACVVTPWAVTMTHAGPLETAAALVFGAVLIASYFLYAPALTQILHSFGAWREAARKS
jgi:hypothetical protein